jgi:hypothetical protein
VNGFKCRRIPCQILHGLFFFDDVDATAERGRAPGSLKTAGHFAAGFVVELQDAGRLPYDARRRQPIHRSGKPMKQTSAFRTR